MINSRRCHKCCHKKQNQNTCTSRSSFEAGSADRWSTVTWPQEFCATFGCKFLPAILAHFQITAWNEPLGYLTWKVQMYEWWICMKPYLKLRAEKEEKNPQNSNKTISLCEAAWPLEIVYCIDPLRARWIFSSNEHSPVSANGPDKTSSK